MAVFNTSLRDSQSTDVEPIAPENFDFDAYCDYEAGLLPANSAFAGAESGLLVYRRFRADGVFYDKCKNPGESLALQLGALQASMAYRADIANFLEPWYGIGYITSCFGSNYSWRPGQAPEPEIKFGSCAEILAQEPKPIKDTPIGKHILEMIEYFLDRTKGRMPVSFTDIQSPLNMLSYLMPTTELFMEFYSDREGLRQAAARVADLLTDFLREQAKLIGGALAKPGHGFASSRVFHGVGASDDMSLMLSAGDYEEIFMPLDEQIGEPFGGFCYHSCGNWAAKIDMVRRYRNILTADGAFGPETDPAPNDPALFGRKFAGSGVCLNARCVGRADDVFPVFQKLWRPAQKLIAVTYCQTPEEQDILYGRLHALTGGGSQCA
ncbi:MAG: uroporphyrinogen decarboxylase family protein [Firmicutes bacterium]|nr:uroporphyrinogen decarboxylase family protein [Bacillota bacterium]